MISKVQGQRAVTSRWLLLVLPLTCVCVGACGDLGDTVFPPVRMRGAVGDRFITTDTSEARRTYTNQVTTSLRGNSFLYQPWLATVQAGVATAYETRNGGTDTVGDSVLASGDATLNVFPISKFPTTLSYAHTDSRVEGIGAQDFVRDRASIDSRVIILNDLRTFTRLNYEDITQPGFGNEERQDYTTGFSKNFDKDSVNLTFRYSDRDFKSRFGDDSKDTIESATIAVNTVPFKDASWNVQTLLLSSDEVDGDRLRDRNTVQGVTTGQWRAKDLPISMNLATRVLTEDIDEGTISGAPGFGDTREELASATLGLNYPIRPRLTANFGLSGDYRKIERGFASPIGEIPAAAEEPRISGSLFSGVNYLSLPEDLIAGFKWRWNAGGNTIFSYVSEEERSLEDTETTNAGHTFERDFDMPAVGPVRLSVNENGTATHGSEVGNEFDLGHRLNLTHTSFEDGVRTFGSLSISDRRQLLGDDDDEFQLAQFQLTRQTSVDIRSSWFANLSLQASRRKTSDNEADISASANGAIGFLDRELGDIRNLEFETRLELSQIGLEEVISKDEEEGPRSEFFRSEWITRLGYRIGRLLAETEASVFREKREKEVLGSSILVRVLREFDASL